MDSILEEARADIPAVLVIVDADKYCALTADKPPPGWITSKQFSTLRLRKTVQNCSTMLFAALPTWLSFLRLECEGIDECIVALRLGFALETRPHITPIPFCDVFRGTEQNGATEAISDLPVIGGPIGNALIDELRVRNDNHDVVVVRIQVLRPRNRTNRP